MRTSWREGSRQNERRVVEGLKDGANGGIHRGERFRVIPAFNASDSPRALS